MCTHSPVWYVCVHLRGINKKMKITTSIVIAIFVIDFFCFNLWILSGQAPQDGFYFGMITANIIKLII